MIKEIVYNSPSFIRDLLINGYGAYLYKRRFNNNFNSFFKELKKNLSKSRAQVRKEQFKKLKQTLVYSYKNITYYNSLFTDIDFDPYLFSDFKELKQIPFLTKRKIRENFDNLVNPNIPNFRYREHSTSGSTGEKLKFLIPNELHFAKNAAFIYRHYALLDIEPGDRRVTLGGRKFTNKKPYWTYNWFENQLLMSSHHLDEQTVVSYLEKIEEFDPVFIQGHPSAILLLAEYIESKDISFNLSLKGIFTTGETLLEKDRDVIEKAFTTIVLQYYGSGESCFTAMESPSKKGFMINYEHGFIELIGSGEYKEVVATSFQNTVMPFVRYKVGDLVRQTDKQSVKYGLPILFDKVIGRIDDVITYDSKQVLPVAIRMALKPLLYDSSNYQLIQKSNSYFQLFLMDPQRRLNVNEFKDRIKSIINDNINISVDFKESLISGGGKIRNVINDSNE